VDIYNEPTLFWDLGVHYKLRVMVPSLFNSFVVTMKYVGLIPSLLILD